MRSSPFRSFRSLIAAVAVHVLALAILSVSLRFNPPTTPSSVKSDTQIVAAVAVDQSEVQAELQRIRDTETRKREAEQAHQRELQRKAEALKKERQGEEQRLAQLKEQQQALEKQKKEEQEKLKETTEKRKAEEDRKAKLAEESKRLEQENTKAQAEHKRLAEEKKQMEERKRKEAEERQLAEKKKVEERARIAAALEEKKRSEEAQKLKKALAEEERARAEAERQERDQAEIDRYITAIQRSVENTFVTPIRGLKCIILVRTAPGGEVMDATIVQSSGDATFDRQAEIAVRKASPLPVPADPRLFDQAFREFQFEFAPRG